MCDVRVVAVSNQHVILIVDRISIFYTTFFLSVSPMKHDGQDWDLTIPIGFARPSGYAQAISAVFLTFVTNETM